MYSGDYRCAKCNEPLNSITMGLQCEKCGYKIFLKDSLADKKVYSSD